jgi:capsular polysaccharide biosynthesis protein
MDIRLFVDVVRRFKYLVAAGVVLACVAAFLSYVKVGPHGFSYRQKEMYSSTARLLVTSPAANGQDPASLAVIYSQYATSDEVIQAAIRSSHVRGTLQGDSGYVNSTSTALPTVTVSGIAPNPVNASIIANAGVVALKRFVAQQQKDQGLPPGDRAYLSNLNDAIPLTATIVTPRSKTPPIFAFIVVLAATFGLVFALENLRPRVRPVLVEVEAPRPSGAEATRPSGEARQARQG